MLHSAGTGAPQWRRTAEALAGTNLVLTPNLRGYGRTAPVEAGEDRLEAEIDVARAMAELAGDAVHLVGHSLGALVAAQMARQAGASVHRLTLIEPVVVGVLHDRGAVSSLDEIGAMIRGFQTAFQDGNTAAAMRIFAEYWSGAGAWDAIPAAARLPFFARAGKMAKDVDLAWADRTRCRDLADIRCRVDVVSAHATTPAARRMAELVAGCVGRGRLEITGEGGHMLPMTHPELTASLIGREPSPR